MGQVAGVTTYSPMKRQGAKAGDKVGLVGSGSLGDVVAKIAVAMGADVTVLTTIKGKVA